MARVNKSGYIERRVSGLSHGVKKRGRFSKYVKTRDWWLIKHTRGLMAGQIDLGSISFPGKYVGRRVRIKVEIIDD